MTLERFFQILAVVLAGVAAFFLWQDNGDWAFAAGVAAVCAFFLSVRFRIKARMKEREKNSGDGPERPEI